jgi:ParB family chromosome partitioning protein
MPDEGRSRLGAGLPRSWATSAPKPRRPSARAINAACRSNISAQSAQSAPQFSEAELDELAASIKERGIIQPVVVRSLRGAKDAYEIIAGERRWRAAQRAGLHDVPIVPFEASDSEALELAIIENVQRSRPQSAGRGGGYQALASEYDHSHDDIAKIVGKSRSHVTNTLRLLKLPEPVKAYIHAGKITAGAARMLIGRPTRRRWRARSSIAGSTSVRSRRWRRSRGKKSGSRVSKRALKSPGYPRARTTRFRCARLAVTVDHRGNGGVLQIHYRSLDQLDDVLRRLGEELILLVTTSEAARMRADKKSTEHRRERMAMAKQVRRVVTGHDRDGKAIVISDGPAPFVHVNAVNPEWYSTDIWRTRETPARIATAADEPTLGPRRQMPDKRGTVLRINHFPPENEAVRQMDPQASRAAFAALGNEKAATFGKGGPPSAHAQNRDHRLRDRAVGRDHDGAGRCRR